MKKDDPDTDAWMIMGISTRFIMRIGYHRDPRHLANISPFEGEMRRRIFFVVESLGLLFSLQVGLPPIIEEECARSLRGAHSTQTLTSIATFSHLLGRQLI
jgi:hypothetical protein